MSKDKEWVWVIVTDQHRGIWYGRTDGLYDLAERGWGILNDACHIRHYKPANDGKGLLGLALQGPASGSLISRPEDRAPFILIRSISKVIPVSAAAAERFAAQGWGES
jgi:hypothetical protein